MIYPVQVLYMLAENSTAVYLWGESSVMRLSRIFKANELTMWLPWRLYLLLTATSGSYPLAPPLGSTESAKQPQWLMNVSVAILFLSVLVETDFILFVPATHHQPSKQLEGRDSSHGTLKTCSLTCLCPVLLSFIRFLLVLSLPSWRWGISWFETSPPAPELSENSGGCLLSTSLYPIDSSLHRI